LQYVVCIVFFGRDFLYKNTCILIFRSAKTPAWHKKRHMALSCSTLQKSTQLFTKKTAHGNRLQHITKIPANLHTQKSAHGIRLQHIAKIPANLYTKNRRKVKHSMNLHTTDECFGRLGKFRNRKIA